MFSALAIEDAFHLFRNCSHILGFWSYISAFIIDHIFPEFVLCFEHVLYGLHVYSTQ